MYRYIHVYVYSNLGYSDDKNIVTQQSKMEHAKPRIWENGAAVLNVHLETSTLARNLQNISENIHQKFDTCASAVWRKTLVHDLHT